MRTLNYILNRLIILAAAFCLGLALGVTVVTLKQFASRSSEPRHKKAPRFIGVSTELALESPVFVKAATKRPAKFNAIFALVDINNYSAFCSAFALSDTVAMTAAHCVMRQRFGIIERTDAMLSRNSKGEVLLNNTITVIEADPSSDIAILRGDFSMFNKMRLASGRRKVGEISVSCGYPGGRMAMACDTAAMTGAYFFNDMYASLRLFPGQSGGPVFDPITREVYGVNSAVNDNGEALIAPVVGVYGQQHELK